MDTNQTPTDPDALLRLVESVKELYQQPPPAPPKPGKKRDFSALSFLLLATVAVTLRTFRDSELHRLLSQDLRLRQSMSFCRVPHRTLIGRRLTNLLGEAEQQIALLGQHLITEIKVPVEQSQISALDGRMYQAQGPKWHKKDRQRGVVPAGLRNVDLETTWSSRCDCPLVGICMGRQEQQSASGRNGYPVSRDVRNCYRGCRVQFDAGARKPFELS